jgi:hypothetical protein
MSARRVARVDSAVTIWQGAVAAGADDRDVDAVHGGHHRAGPGGDHAGPQPRGEHVQGVGGRRAPARGVEHPLGDHRGGAVATLLPRLEHEHHVAGQLLAPPGQQMRGAGEHGGVQVVPAGVHHTVHRGRIVEAGALGQQQGVHVGPQQHRRAGPGAAEDRGDRGQLRAEPDLQRQPVEGGHNLFLRARQVQADLRFGMNGTPQPHQIVLQSACVITN